MLDLSCDMYNLLPVGNLMLFIFSRILVRSCKILQDLTYIAYTLSFFTTTCSCILDLSCDMCNLLPIGNHMLFIFLRTLVKSCKILQDLTYIAYTSSFFTTTCSCMLGISCEMHNILARQSHAFHLLKKSCQIL